MDFCELDSLKKIAFGETLGEIFPYQTKKPELIERFLEEVAGELGALEDTSVDSEFEHYGSGYASFVDLFCYPSDGSSRFQVEKDAVEIHGLTVYLGRLAPVAVLGPQKKYKSPDATGYGFLSAEQVDQTSQYLGTELVGRIRRLVEGKGLRLLDRKEVSPFLPPDTRLSTNLTDSPYRVFDALFYWTD